MTADDFSDNFRPFSHENKNGSSSSEAFNLPPLHSSDSLREKGKS